MFEQHCANPALSEQLRHRPAAFLAAAAVAAAPPARAVPFGGSEFHVAASILVRVSNRQTNLAHRTK